MKSCVLKGSGLIYTLAAVLLACTPLAQGAIVGVSLDMHAQGRAFAPGFGTVVDEPPDLHVDNPVGEYTHGAFAFAQGPEVPSGSASIDSGMMDIDLLVDISSDAILIDTLGENLFVRQSSGRGSASITIVFDVVGTRGLKLVSLAPFGDSGDDVLLTLSGPGVNWQIRHDMGFLPGTLNVRDPLTIDRVFSVFDGRYTFTFDSFYSRFFVGDFGARSVNLLFTALPIPEPSTAALFAVLLVIAARRASPPRTP